MTTAYKHRPMSSILAPATDPKPEGQNTPPRDEQGKFVSPAAQEPQTTLPEKYVGKSAEEIATMHMNAEQELGRVRNEIGSLRGVVNDLSQLQRTAPETTTVEKEEIALSGDELLTDPAGAIDKVVTARLNEANQANAVNLEEQQVAFENQRLITDFPTLDTIVASSEFQEFAGRTPTRQQDFVTAAQGSGLEQTRAARRLLEDFADFQSQTKPTEPADATQHQAPVQPQTVPAAQRTEGAGPGGAVSTKPLVYEADVLNLIQTDPAKYRSPSFQTELMAAMKEGRYVKAG